ncbi:MAG: hypothetical protein GY867_08810 [bacterium]|nr:hypothetical protein [bacterium]
MNLLKGINHYFLLILDTLRKIGHWRVWLVLMGYFLLNWFLLYAHYDFMSPLFYNVIKSWTLLVDADLAPAFTHYPQQFVLMDHYFGWSKIGLGLLFEGLMLGIVARLFARRVYRRQIESRSVWSLWMHLMIVWIVLNGLWMLAASQIPALAAPYLTGPRRIMAFAFAFLPFVFVAILSVLYCALPAVVIYGDNALKAVIRSLRLFLSRPFTSFFLAALVLAVPTFVAAIISRPDQVIDKFRPELIYYLLLAGLAIEIPANFLWIGTAVHFLRDTED